MCHRCNRYVTCLITILSKIKDSNTECCCHGYTWHYIHRSIKMIIQSAPKWSTLEATSGLLSARDAIYNYQSVNKVHKFSCKRCEWLR